MIDCPSASNCLSREWYSQKYLRTSYDHFKTGTPYRNIYFLKHVKLYEIRRHRRISDLKFFLTILFGMSSKMFYLIEGQKYESKKQLSTSYRDV
jgi:hypothetical protein